MSPIVSIVSSLAGHGLLGHGGDLCQEVKEGQSVGIVVENVLAPATPGSEAVNGTREFKAERTGHGRENE